MGMTLVQKTTFDFIREYSEQNGIAPSYDEIMVELGFKSKSSVHRVINLLEERGLIRRLTGRARSVKIIDHSDGAYGVLGPFLDPFIRHCVENKIAPDDALRCAVSLYLGGATQ